MSRTHFTGVGFPVGPGVHDCSAYLHLRDLGDEVLKKTKLFSKNRGLAGFRGDFRLRAGLWQDKTA
jgi:hypothetical protein